MKLAGLAHALAALACCTSLGVCAQDILIRHRTDNGTDRRLDYDDIVLAEAMRRTERKWGPYQIKRGGDTVVRERLLAEMVRGDEVNVSVVASQPSWEEQLIPIWIPLDRGLSNYRISFIRRGNEARTSELQYFDQLQRLTLGVGAGWSSRKVLEANSLRIETAENTDALIKMLLADRFDIFPRGINEIFFEYDARSSALPDLAIEEQIALYFPLPGYAFVSPKAPRLAARLKEGLESMVADGTLVRIMQEFHAETLKRANLCKRRIIRFNNPFVSPNTPLARKELWFDPFDPKTGICPPRKS